MWRSPLRKGNDPQRLSKAFPSFHRVSSWLATAHRVLFRVRSKIDSMDPARWTDGWYFCHNGRKAALCMTKVVFACSLLSQRRKAPFHKTPVDHSVPRSLTDEWGSSSGRLPPALGTWRWHPRSAQPPPRLACTR